MKLAVAAVALAALALALVFWPRDREDVPAAEAAAVAAAPAQPGPVSRIVSADSPSFTRMANAFAARAPRPSAEVARAVEEARAGHIDPVELGRQLRAGEGPALLDALVPERSPEIALQLARALAARLDDEALRGQTIAALRANPPARRVGLLALLGRSDDASLQLAADALEGDADPEARATAAFILHNAPVAALPDRAWPAARAALGDAHAGDRLREEAATLLGRPGAPGGDLDLLESRALDDVPAVRMRALAALDIAGDSRLGTLCGQILSDASAPDRLSQMAKAWMAAHH